MLDTLLKNEPRSTGADILVSHANGLRTNQTMLVGGKNFLDDHANVKAWLITEWKKEVPESQGESMEKWLQTFFRDSLPPLTASHQDNHVLKLFYAFKGT
jgi:hypothetical protein